MFFSTRILHQHRQPMIKFLGKRTVPSKLDHTPHAHPASPTHALPDSFASYRQKAQQHGPLGGNNGASTTTTTTTSAHPHGSSGSSLGPVEPAKGEYFDRSELPRRFWRTPFSLEEIEAVESGGASLVG